MAGPCNWVIDTCACGTCWDSYSPAVRADAADRATLVMWTATGRRYGPCDVTVLPCNPPPPPPLYRTYPVGWPGAVGDGDEYGIYPVLASGQWFNRACGSCSCAAACACAVPLPGPVQSVAEVRLDGAVMDAAGYVVVDKSSLVRVDGKCWPTCQTAGLQIPTFEAAYRRGLAIPPAVLGAARMLACEFAKLCSGGDCALPQQIRSLSRSGISVDIDTPVSAVSAGGKHPAGRVLTGVAAVDQVILADNPYGQTGPRTIVSPDDPAVRQVTWSASS